MFTDATYMTVWWPPWHSCGSCTLRPLFVRMRWTGASWLLPWQPCWLTEGRCWRAEVEKEYMGPGVAKVKRLQAVVEAVSAAGQAFLFTHNLEQFL